MKTCSACKEAKPLDEFNVCRSKKDGRQSACKACRTAKYAANREAATAAARAWRAANLERARATGRRYQEEHREENAARAAAWYAANRDKARLRNAEWRAAHAEYTREVSAQWRRDNPDKIRELRHRRRARERAAAVEDFTTDELLASWEVRGLAGCTYCPDGEFEHLDHVIPLSRGGTHTVANLVPACARCNQSKGAKLLEEWLPGHQARLAASA